MFSCTHLRSASRYVRFWKGDSLLTSFRLPQHVLRDVQTGGEKILTTAAYQVEAAATPCIYSDICRHVAGDTAGPMVSVNLSPAAVVPLDLARQLPSIFPHILAGLSQAPGRPAGVPCQPGRQATPACVPAVHMLRDLPEYSSHSKCALRTIFC